MPDETKMADLYVHGIRVAYPLCPKCKTKMDDDGECSEGCCDDFKCPQCGYTVRIECAD